MKLEIHQQIFKKYSKIKFHKTAPSENQVVPGRQADRYDEANSHFSHFCEHT
jgi:hypothetical protein